MHTACQVGKDRKIPALGLLHTSDASSHHTEIKSGIIFVQTAKFRYSPYQPITCQWALRIHKRVSFMLISGDGHRHTGTLSESTCTLRAWGLSGEVYSSAATANKGSPPKSPDLQLHWIREVIIIHEHGTMIRQQEQKQTSPWGTNFRLRESNSSVTNPWRGDAPAVQDLHSEQLPQSIQALPEPEGAGALRVPAVSSALMSNPWPWFIPTHDL